MHQLAELLLKETRPPRKFGDAPDVALVLFQASRIPEAKIRPIFDDAQWRIMSRWMAVYIQESLGRRNLEEERVCLRRRAGRRPCRSSQAREQEKLEPGRLEREPP